MRTQSKLIGLFFAFVVVWVGFIRPCGAVPVDLTQLSIEDLMEIEITSVAKKSQKLSEATAAIYVITQQDLKRSGATTIADALRMVPGMFVARVDSNKWVVASRGYTGHFASKLLVMQDGRTLYEPTFSYVFWDVLDTLLEDVERIEVVRGPGASLWGGGAVNGVINIITRRANDTQGTLVSGILGSDLKPMIGLRHGSQLTSNGAYRVYAKAFAHDGAVDRHGRAEEDDWRMLRGGFRTDWNLTDNDTFTVQSDAYSGKVGGRDRVSDQSPPDYVSFIANEHDVGGAHLIARWNRWISTASELSLQAYVDYTDRESVTASQKRTTFDMEIQHRFPLADMHDILWGLGYRLTADRIQEQDSFDIDPDNRTVDTISGFVQDDIQLWPDRVKLILGSKFEHNDYSGFEVQPTARLLLTPSRMHTLWLAASKAVRTPDRFEVDSRSDVRTVDLQQTGWIDAIPYRVNLVGNPDMETTELIAIEGGYRVDFKDWLELDMALFFNHYENLITGETIALYWDTVPAAVDVQYDNKMSGDTFGFELTSTFIPTPRLQLLGSYAFFDSRIELDQDSTDAWSGQVNNGSPRHQASLRCLTEPFPHVDFDLWFRFVDEVPRMSIDGYLTLDLRLAWRPHPNIELSLVAQDLLENKHLEAIDQYFLTQPTLVEPAVFAKLTWRL